MKRSIPVILFIFSFLFYSFAFAQSNDPQINTEIEIFYGSHITLAAEMVAIDLPKRAAAFLRPANREDTLVVEATISHEADSYELEAEIVMQPPAFDPFEVISIWWQIEFENGATWNSPSLDVRYEDNRFPWQSRSDERIHVHWVTGNPEFGEKVYELTSQALNSIGQTLGLMPPADLSIYIYPSRGDLQSALQIGGAPWIEGHTLPDLGVILIAASDDPETLITLERDIPHELTHLLLFERMRDSYRNLPAWLGEGLATLQEKQANPAYRFELESAVKSNALLSMESLCASFPISERDALLAYAQSASFTQYLLDVYGMGGILQLLDTYQQGVTCTGGIQRIYQRPLSQLENEWKALHLQAPTFWQRIEPILPWGLLLLLVIVLVLIGVTARNRNPGLHEMD